MIMNLKIHRGTKEIGGSCVEIWTEATRIVVDFGLPLVNPDKTRFDSRPLGKQSVSELLSSGILPDIPGLYDGAGNTALLLSHAHQDHYGLLQFAAETGPVYLGKATHKLIELTSKFSRLDLEIKVPQYFVSGKSFSIGDIEITPFLMDHSAFDSYGFLIKADGTSLFYSGDFRSHGRKAKNFRWFSHNVETNIDCLLLEGTSMGRNSESYKTEYDIEDDFFNTFGNTSGINLIYTSGQNIDRLVSIYKACKRARKILAVDFYVANILKDLAEFAALPYPSKDYPEIRVFYPHRLAKMISRKGLESLLYRFKNYKITKEEIDNKHEDIVMLIRPSMKPELNHIEKLSGGTFIYSLWEGYKKDKSTKDFINYLVERGMNTIDIHTSGHADIDALKKMVEILNPSTIIPIHTFKADSYKEIFDESRIRILNDKEVISFPVH